jgi:thiaminase/transcriptional activator TenA
VYKAVGDYIIAQQPVANNPYQAWIDTYSGEEFGLAVQAAIDIYDNLAEHSSQAERDKMLDRFVMCSKMEWMFWNSAYKQEKWLV